MTEKLSREQTGDGTESRTYDYDSRLMRTGQSTKATSSAPAAYRSYATDANGSVEGLEDANGALASSDSYQYDPYGALQNTPAGDAADAPFRFEGFYLDSGVKTYDMQARSYRPDIGRFTAADRYESAGADLTLQSDPLTQNRYAFAAGNPINNIEWDGHGRCGERFCTQQELENQNKVALGNAPTLKNVRVPGYTRTYSQRGQSKQAQQTRINAADRQGLAPGSREANIALASFRENPELTQPPVIQRWTPKGDQLDHLRGDLCGFSVHIACFDSDTREYDDGVDKSDVANWVVVGITSVKIVTKAPGLARQAPKAFKSVRDWLGLGRGATNATKAASGAIDAGSLSAEQATNLARYARKLPSGAGEPQIVRLPDRSVRFSSDVPGRVPGSYARYIKTVDESGTTTGYFKETYGPNGELIHSKKKYGPGG